jgi:hypothetical protein
VGAQTALQIGGTEAASDDVGARAREQPLQRIEHEHFGERQGQAHSMTVWNARAARKVRFLPCGHHDY